MLVSVAQLKAHIGASDNADDALLQIALSEAEAALGGRYTLPTVPAATETRTLFADGSLVHLPESCTVSEVTDLDDAPLAHIIVPGGLMLHHPITGYVKVTGEWGYPSTPTDVMRAILVTAATYYKRQTYGSDDAPYRGGGSAIPTEAEQIMGARRTVRI